MFTGLVQQVGILRRVVRRGLGLRLQVGYAPWDEPVAIGESIAVQGACLTVSACGMDELSFDVLAESVARTDLAAQRPGAALNLERALRLSDRFGGHFMTGHIDGVGRVAACDRVEDDWALTIACDAGLLGDMALKGSIAVSGVSLTIATLTSSGFSVYIIPHTWTHTALCKFAVGGLVNLETDLLAKHVRRCLEIPSTGMDQSRVGRARSPLRAGMVGRGGQLQSGGQGTDRPTQSPSVTDPLPSAPVPGLTMEHLHRAGFGGR